MKMKKQSDQNSENQRSNLYIRSRIIFISFIILLTFFLIWPGYKLFANPEPFILGFPLSFAWVILCTVFGFAALLRLYISDNQKEEED